MEIIYDIPAEPTFALPQGNFRAILVRVEERIKVNSGQQVKMLRFLFEVQIPSLTNKIPMAGRNFVIELSSNSALRQFIQTWVGAGFFEGKTAFDPRVLIGQEGDVILTHLSSTSHKTAFVNIESIHPVGTLQLTEEPVVQPPESPVEEVKEAA